MSRKLRVAVGQMTSVKSHKRNLGVVTQLAQRAHALDCRMLFLPEACAFLGLSSSETVANALDLTQSEVVDEFKSICKRFSLWMNFGCHEKSGDAEDSRAYNTQVMMDSEGKIRSCYRKVHLFDVDLGAFQGPILKESGYTREGKELCSAKVDVPGKEEFVIGMTTCYDLRFPEMYSNLRFGRPGDMHAFTVPSAFTVRTGAAHWDILLRARAIETQSYVIASAQAGKHSEKRESYGHSMVVDPWGTIIAKLDGTTTDIAVADLDLDVIESVREKMPLSKHRRKGRNSLGWENETVPTSTDL